MEESIALYEGLAVEEIAREKKSREASLWDERIRPYREAAQQVADLRPSSFDGASDIVRIGEASDLSDEERGRLEPALRVFCPWKKGPFSLFGVEIDAEWRSDQKWARILPHIQPLAGRRIADIGCHNGYFMFRMAARDPALVVGFEPVAKHYWAFSMMQQWVNDPRLRFELLGVEQIDLFPQFFDTIFCLGILYHHTDPMSLLRKMRAALAPKGEIIIDCQGIAGDLPVALTPRRRYANASGIWFLPTRACLENWVARAGYTEIQFFFAQPLSTLEQRRTPWADIDSLAEALDPNDPTKTCEGYPAPWRFYLRAKKG